MANLIKKEFIMEKGKIAKVYFNIINKAKKLLFESAKLEMGLDRRNLVIIDFFKEDIKVIGMVKNENHYIRDNTFICITSVIIPSNKFKKLKIKSQK